MSSILKTNNIEAKDADADLNIRSGGSGSVIINGIKYPLIPGTEGQILKFVSGGIEASDLPPDSGNDWKHLSTVSISNDLALDFTGISDSYISYAILVHKMAPTSNGAELFVRITDDNGVSWKMSSYQYHLSRGDTSANTYAAGTATGSSGFSLASSVKSDEEESYAGIVRVLGDFSKAWPPKFITEGSTKNSGNVTTFYRGGGNYNGQFIKVNGFRLIFNTGNILLGSASLYGLKAD